MPPPPPSSSSFVEDSQGDDDSDYSYEADLLRHRSRREAFKKELQIHSRKMPARPTKRKLLSPITSLRLQSQPQSQPTSSPDDHSFADTLQSSGDDDDDERDDSEDDVLAFLQPKQTSRVSGPQAAAPKLTMADIREQIAKNKARDQEIHRAQRLLDESDSLKQNLAQPSTANLDSYIQAREDNQSLLNMLKPTGGKSEQLQKWTFFGASAGTAHHLPLDELCSSIRASNSITAFLGSDAHHLGVEYIRDLLVSGAMMDCLGNDPSELELPLRHLLLDAVCSSGDEAVSFSCLTLVMDLHEQFVRILDQKRIHRIFELIGGSRVALDTSKPLLAEPGDLKQEVPHGPNWSNISLVIKMLSRLLQGLGDEQLRTLWALIVRLSLDGRRVKERRGHAELFDLMENLLERLEGGSDSLTQIILSDIQTSVTDRSLQAQFLSLVPTTTSFSHEFRKRLARLFLSGDPIYLGTEPGPGILMGSIVAILTSKEVRVSKGESHFQVQNIVDIINIAVDDARWCLNVLERNEKGASENLLNKLIVRLKNSKEFIQENNDLNIDKSNAKDSFAKLIMRLESIQQKRRGKQTVMDKYFQPNSR